MLSVCFMFFLCLTGGTDLISCFAGQNPSVPVYRGEIQSRNLAMAVECWSHEGRNRLVRVVFRVCVCVCVCVCVFGGYVHGMLRHADCADSWENYSLMGVRCHHM